MKKKEMDAVYRAFKKEVERFDGETGGEFGDESFYFGAGAAALMDCLVGNFGADEVGIRLSELIVAVELKGLLR